MEPQALRKIERKRRVITGAGGGTAIGGALSIVLAFLYKEWRGVSLPSEVGIALGVILGALASTAAICSKDLFDLVREWLHLKHRP